MGIQWRFLVAIAGLAFAAPAKATQTAPPYSYKEVVPGGKYVFVMISPPRYVEYDSKVGQEIRRMYARSGMYRNDGSTDPLWTVDWYWYSYGLEFAADGVHMVGYYPIVGAADQLAICFYADGKLVRSYQIRELVHDPYEARGTAWGYERRLDHVRLEYTVQTKEHNWFVFDLRTGDIVSTSPPAPAVQPVRPDFWGPAVAVIMLGMIAWVAWGLRSGAAAPIAESNSEAVQGGN